MDTGIVPLVKQVVIIFTIIVAVFIIISFGIAKIKALVTGKKPPKTGPELYAAQLAMQKNPNQPQVKKARIPSKEKKSSIDTVSSTVEAKVTVENPEKVKASTPPTARRNDEARRSRAQSRVTMNMVQKSIPKRNVFQVINAQQANYRGISTGNIDYSPQSTKTTSQASLRDQSLHSGHGTPSHSGRTAMGKGNINFR